MVPNDLVSRAEWNARPATSFTVANWALRDAFVVHYSAGSPTQTMRQIQDFHMDVKGWSDIGYNLAVDVNGLAYEGRGWNRVPAATKDHNTHTIACLFIGSNQHVTSAAKNKIRALYDEACQRKGATLLQRWHSYYNPTECPGTNLRTWVQSGMPTTQIQGVTDVSRMIQKNDGSPAVYVTDWVTKRHVPNEPARDRLIPVLGPVMLCDPVDVDSIPEVTGLPAALDELLARPPVESAPVSATELAAAFETALDDPDVRAKLIAIVNAAEDS